jgi:histidinol phosphatase-like PHP family hydrolase
MPAFRLLVIADTHYCSDRAEAAAAPAARHCLLGCELLRRAIEDAARRGPFDAVALMGDVINDARQLGAVGDLRHLREEVRAAAPGCPLLVVGGNHDNEDDIVLDAFGFRPGLVELGGYRFLAFSDAYEEGKYGTRRDADRRLLREVAGRPGGPIVVLQHSPMNPPIDSDYPFMLTNRRQVMRDYADCGVLLSLSGHYHPGQVLNAADGVRYCTAPGICEPPFAYAVVTLDGTEVAVEQRRLSLEHLPVLVDTHVHTELAYCAQDITAAAAIERARTFGLAGLYLTEHAPQLYCRGEDFWSGRHIRQPQCWRRAEHSRMGDFRRAVEPLRGDFVRIGLEVELDRDGRLTLHEEDRQWADLIVGAIHFLRRDDDPDALSDAELAREVMRTNEAILARGVDVLAHPWRLFRSRGRRSPAELYGDLADMLAATGTAAEMNLHNSYPDPAFFAECIRRGVKVALASDAHELWEVALLAAHVEMLRHAAGRQDISDLLLH